MKKTCLVISVAAMAAVMALACVGNASATLVGVVQTYPDVTLDNSYIIYDHNGVDSNTGLFRIVSMGSTLNKALGVATPKQLYSGSGDIAPAVMISAQLDNVTGAFKGGNVSITTGNIDPLNPAAPRFSWLGTVSEIGFLDNGTQFDARWTLNSDQYQNMPSGFTEFTNGSYSGSTGGITIGNTAGLAGNFLETGLMSRDWVLGAGVTSNSTSANIAPFLLGLNAENGKIQMDSSIQADAFLLHLTQPAPTIPLPPQPVPLPGAIWLMMGGFGMLVSFARRKGSRITQ
jgi:hypothetical protein